MSESALLAEIKADFYQRKRNNNNRSLQHRDTEVDDEPDSNSEDENFD